MHYFIIALVIVLVVVYLYKRRTESTESTEEKEETKEELTIAEKVEINKQNEKNPRYASEAGRFFREREEKLKDILEGKNKAPIEQLVEETIVSDDVLEVQNKYIESINQDGVVDNPGAASKFVIRDGADFSGNLGLHSIMRAKQTRQSRDPNFAGMISETPVDREPGFFSSNTMSMW